MSSSITLELHFNSDPCPCLCLSYVATMSMYPVNLHLTSWHDRGSASLLRTGHQWLLAALVTASLNLILTLTGWLDFST